MAGARVDRTRFDIGVLTFDGARDTDHPILQLRTVQPHGALGASVRVRRGVLAGAELFYAPGSLVTGRVSGKWIVRQ
jgi:acetyltransferase-like isoleucine patch superfamily enzyme